MTGLKVQNIQTAPKVNNKQFNQKIGRKPKQTFSQRRHIDGQQEHEKMLLIAKYQRNVNKNFNEISLHIIKMAILKKSVHFAEDVE